MCLQELWEEISSDSDPRIFICSSLEGAWQVLKNQLVQSLCRLTVSGANKNIFGLTHWHFYKEHENSILKEPTFTNPVGPFLRPRTILKWTTVLDRTRFEVFFSCGKCGKIYQLLVDLSLRHILIYLFPALCKKLVWILHQEEKMVIWWLMKLARTTGHCWTPGFLQEKTSFTLVSQDEDYLSLYPMALREAFRLWHQGPFLHNNPVCQSSLNLSLLWL